MANLGTAIAYTEISQYVSGAKQATDFTHTSISYAAFRDTEIYHYIEGHLVDIRPPAEIPDPKWTAQKDAYIYQYVENYKVATAYTQALPPAIICYKDTLFSQYFVNPALTVNPDTDYKHRRHNNYKITGQIYPRLYDWTGRNHGTFR